MASSPKSETTVPDDDDAAVDAIVEDRVSSRPRGCRRTRVIREENARLTSAGVSVNVSADDRGELSGVMGAATGGKDTALDCTVRFLQRGRGMERPRGDDGAEAGAEGTIGTCSWNETWRTGSGLGRDSVFLWVREDRDGARSCARGIRRCGFSVITGGPLRIAGTSHVRESTATLDTKPVHPAAMARSTTRAVCATARALLAPSAMFKATPNRMLT